MMITYLYRGRTSDATDILFGQNNNTTVAVKEAPKEEHKDVELPNVPMASSSQSGSKDAVIEINENPKDK